MKVLKISGAIVPKDDAWFYDWLEMDYTTTTNVEEFLADMQGAEPITVQINSGGGDVWTGSEIYSMLKNYAGHVTVEIESLCASIATVIASAGDTVKMSPVAQYMIHGASMIGQGNRSDMEQYADFLEKVDTTIRNAYLLKTKNVTAEQLTQWMETDTWFTPQEALEHGFVDEIMYDYEGTLSNPVEVRAIAYAGGGLIPSKKIKAFKEKTFEEKTKKQENVKILEAKLKYLQLGGVGE